jgi:hypothetical protein
VDESQLTDETIAAREAGDNRHLDRIARAEKMNTLSDLDPKYTAGADGDNEAGDSSDLEARMERQAELNERAGAEGTAEALRRLKEAESPEKALQKARRRAENMGDDYAAQEFSQLLSE